MYALVKQRSLDTARAAGTAARKLKKTKVGPACLLTSQLRHAYAHSRAHSSFHRVDLIRLMISATNTSTEHGTSCPPRLCTNWNK